MPSSEDSSRYSNRDKERLLALAWESIEYGLKNNRPKPVDSSCYPEQMQEKLASFVTLNREGMLRGCIGHLEATQPLVKDIAENAYSAAFRDPRFPALKERELAGLELHISILSKSVQMEFGSEQDLVNQIKPGYDGLILELGAKRGTFLPSVWESLQDVPSFLRHLKIKAGLDPGFWSEEIKIYRYSTESFTDTDSEPSSTTP